MSWLLESPASIGALGAVVVFFLVLAWVQIGRSALLYLAGGAVVATILLLILERCVVTDSEAVQETLYQVARDVQSNNTEQLVGHIVQSKPEMKTQAANEMSQHHFTDVTIGKIHRVTVNAKHQPPEVEIEFNVTVSGQFFRGIDRENEPRWVRLVFWKEDDGQWRIAEYEHDEPTRFMKKRSDEK